MIGRQRVATLGLLAPNASAPQSDWPGFSYQRIGCPLGKESAVVNIPCLAIQQVEEIFLQGLATGPRLGRERAAGGFRDAPNLEGDHECILPLHRSQTGEMSQTGDRAASSSRTSGATSVPKSSIERIVLA